MSDFKCAEMDGIPPFPENGEPVAVTVPRIQLRSATPAKSSNLS
nr:hypothetical protein OKNFBMNL_00195 [Klebsiella quasipneumoniae subsp. quasipneumoniae]